jgi:hypothetical protein
MNLTNEDVDYVIEQVIHVNKIIKGWTVLLF